MKSLRKNLKIAAVLLGLWSSQVPLSAVNEKGEWPWKLKLHGWHDRVVAEDLGAGWFLNAGPTGLRARITHEHPQYLTIKYVFKNPPAHGQPLHRPIHRSRFHTTITVGTPGRRDRQTRLRNAPAMLAMNTAG